METTYYTAKEAARKLGISTQTFYRWVKNHWIYTTKLPNGTIRVSEESLADIMARHSDDHPEDIVRDALRAAGVLA